MNKPADILYFVLVFLLQLVIADYLHLGPFICISLIPFLILNIPLSRSPHTVMLTAFGLGLVLDVLSAGVPGMNAFAAVLTATLRKFLYRTLVNSDRQDKTEVPLLKETGLRKYGRYLSALVATYLAAYILLDCVSFRPAGFLAVKFVVSSFASLVLSMLLAVSIQNRN